MTKNDAPAPVDLPEKLRVHALAKLIGRTSREVVAALGGLGVEVKSAQSSIDRKVAEQVVTALVGDAAGVPSPAEVGAEAGAEVGPEVGAEVGAERGAAVDADAAAAAAPLAPLFAPPAPVFQPPGRPARGRRRAVSAPAEEAAEPAAEEAAVVSEASAPAAEAPARRRRRSRSAPPADEPVETAEPEAVAETEADTEVEDEADDEAGAAGPDDDDSGDASRRRRRRGRRGRGRGRGVDDESDEAGTDDDESDEEAGEETGADEGDEADDAGSSRRRRRRRRRRGSGDGDDEARPDDDPPGTVTRIRAPREPREARDTDDDGVQSVRGSTRLEAKRQRRRDGRDAGRRRQPILSEAEFLARRESVERTMVVRERGHRVEIGVLEDDVLVEHFIADRAGHDGGTGASGPSLVGNIYLGRVQNVLPSMEAAFVDIGRGRNAVLYAGEVDWDAAGLGGKARRIEQALGSGDSVLVQVTKDPIGHKGARLTTQISLAGRFLVYVPSGGAAGISRKLPDIERKRLKDMLKEIVPAEAGVIIRTASEGVSHEALERDVRRLQAQWDVVKEKSEKTGPQKPKAPVLLYEEPDLLIKVVRDQFNEDFSTLVVQGDDAWDTLHGYISHVAPELADRMHRHVGTQDAFAAHRIDEQLLKALDRKVWLPSGGTLVIDRTEAMTVVDVNTGKFTGSGGNLEETVTRNNLEAAEEIVRQLRLRDIGGIIVVDFIDMVLEANRDLVLRRLTECLARDRTRHQVAEVTSLGLVQMTRKRVGGGLLEHFSHPCEHCRGRGVVVDVELPEDTQDHGRPVSENGGSRRSRGGRRRGEGEGNGQNGRGGIAPGTGGSVPRPVAPAAAIMSDMAAAGTDTGAPAPSAAPAVAVVEGVDAAADAVEEAVVERTLVPPVAQVADTRVAAEPPAVENGVAPAPSEVAPSEEPAARPRRRGRVTRTAGAPATAAGDAPVAAVVTVAAGAPESAPAPAPVAPQPEPAAASRPRRSRRAASRPAGPPVDGGGDPS